MDKIGGPIPCEGCTGNIITGTVHRIGIGSEEVFICGDCYDRATKLFTSEDNGLRQFEIAQAIERIEEEE